MIIQPYVLCNAYSFMLQEWYCLCWTRIYLMWVQNIIHWIWIMYICMYPLSRKRLSSANGLLFCVPLVGPFHCINFAYSHIMSLNFHVVLYASSIAPSLATQFSHSLLNCFNSSEPVLQQTKALKCNRLKTLIFNCANKPGLWWVLMDVLVWKNNNPKWAHTNIT